MKCPTHWLAGFRNCTKPTPGIRAVLKVHNHRFCKPKLPVSSPPPKLLLLLLFLLLLIFNFLKLKKVRIITHKTASSSPVLS
jgi:hypothetical protein